MKGKNLRNITGLASALGVCLLSATFFAGPANAQVNGAIFTTDSTGTQVNGNIYAAKTDVYLNGGPQNSKDPGLVPDGTYFFQVTDPSGSVLLSSDDVSCRLVQVLGGRIMGVSGPCPHALGTFNGANGEQPVQLAPFNDTPNNGGEYKAWLTLAADYGEGCPTGHASFGFCDKDSKTDNFKVKKPNVADIVVCKFNDQNDDGLQDNSEPLIPGWPITATGVDAGGPTATGQDGCATYTVSSFTDGTATVTLQEGSEAGFTQTAPANGTCVLTGTFNPSDTCTVSGAGSDTVPTSGGMITLTVRPGDTVTAPFFGNTMVAPSPLLVSKTADGGNNFTWGITKSVDKPEIDDGSGRATFNYTVKLTHDAGTGWVVQGNISVFNPNPGDIANVNVTDATNVGGSCSVPNGVGITVPGNSTVDLPYACTFTTNPGSGTNTATAAWDSTSASGTANFDFSSADTGVTVSDSLFGSLGTVTINADNTTSFTTATGVTGSLGQDGSTVTFTYSQTFNDPAGTCTTHDNTATFTTNTGGTGSSSKSVKQCVGADLTVSKTAAGSFNSNITKSVSPSGTVKQDGGSVTFNYTVTVTESGWTVAGNITVTNPNNWEAVTVNLADALNLSGATCTITGGSSQTVAASSSISTSYTCSFSSAPSAASGTNTATGTWSGASTPDTSASGTAVFSFVSLTITDNFNGTTTTLGTVAGNAASTTFTYSHTITVPTFGCQSFPNTATITQTGQTSSQKVTVCGPERTGALTMGFWQNKNGQGIISGGASTGGVCNSGIYLETLAPYQDLSATATCPQVANYVYNIIKAANASGSSMNAMLKAQMLATALDVFFSTPGLGGNLIGAPAPIGGVVVDLTKVCSVSDGGGSGTCSGAYINTSAAFGGATSATVNFLLAYAAGNSNLGGSLWYGNVKSVQFLAKDTFDAINNQLVFAP